MDASGAAMLAQHQLGRERARIGAQIDRQGFALNTLNPGSMLTEHHENPGERIGWPP